MTRRGPPPQIWLEHDGPNDIHVDLVAFQTRDRIQIPSRGRACTVWLQGSSTVETLFELDEGGRVIVWPWAPYGERIVASREALRRQEKTGATDRMMLIATEERFIRVAVHGARFILYDRVAEHLGVGDAGKLYAIFTPRRFELWSLEFRNAYRMRLAEYLPDGVFDDVED